MTGQAREEEEEIHVFTQYITIFSIFSSTNTNPLDFKYLNRSPLNSKFIKYKYIAKYFKYFFISFFFFFQIHFKYHQRVEKLNFTLSYNFLSL